MRPPTASPYKGGGRGSGIEHRISHCSGGLTASPTPSTGQLDAPVNYSTGLYYTFSQNFFSSLQMDPPFSKWATVTPASPRSLSLTSVSITRAHENRVPLLPTNESPVKPNFRFSFSLSRRVNHGGMMVPKIYRRHFKPWNKNTPNHKYRDQNSRKIWTFPNTLRVSKWISAAKGGTQLLISAGKIFPNENSKVTMDYLHKHTGAFRRLSEKQSASNNLTTKTNKTSSKRPDAPLWTHPPVLPASSGCS